MNDHLDRETSVSVELTEAGMKATSQSRFVAAVDRLGGNIMELLNAPMERRIIRERTVAASEAELIAAVTKFGIEKLDINPIFAERVAERYFTRVFEKQKNKDAVLHEALEDLRHEQGEDVGNDRSLNDEFLNRLEYYSDGASTDQLRQKWGRVLSAEVKKPGTFSAKAMRIVDELDAETAQLFESFCTLSFAEIAPKCLTGILEFVKLKQLIAAGLIVDPSGFGHIAKFAEVQSDEGQELWTFNFGNGRSISVPKGTQFPMLGFGDFIGPIVSHNGVAAIPAYLLTEVGGAISSIFPSNDAPAKYTEQLRASLPNLDVTEYQLRSDGRFQSVENPIEATQEATPTYLQSDDRNSG